MDLISDEREWSDEENRMQNDETVRGERGFEGQARMSSSHSVRSRHMAYEYDHQWDGDE